jgi:hypothetical protein
MTTPEAAPETAPEQVSAAENAAPPPAPDTGKSQSESSSLVDLRLSIGDTLQLDCGTPLGSQRAVVKLIGYLKDRSIIVTAPSIKGRRQELLDNDSVLVRGFSGISAFAFRTFVMRVGRIPFDYVHLSYPDTVFGRSVRRSHRVKTELTGQIVANGPELAEPVTVQIEDISALGALIATEHTFDAEHPVRLSIALTLHGNRVEVEAEGAIVSHRPASTDPAGPQLHRYGIEFKNTDAHDVMLLKSFVYQQIVDFPDSAR